MILTFARLERSHKLNVCAWALTDREELSGPVDVRVLAGDGKPTEGVQRARVQPSNAPIGAAAWLISPEGSHATPCVVLGPTEKGAGLRVLTPQGESESAPEYVWPAPSPGVRPHATGAAVIAARTVLARAEVDPRRFALRWASIWLRGVHERDGLAGATWIDVALLPHQIAALRQVLGSPSIRHILADEVGLGKTVEALMIWSALSAHNRSLRCVVAAPRSLVTQWCLEVRRRAEHHLRAERYEDIPPVYEPDARRNALEEDDLRGIVVAEHGALPDLADRTALIDMLIVDEAHKLNSHQREAVESISRSARHILLLTATPREGRRATGAVRDFRRAFAWAVGLVDPKWPPLDVPEEARQKALELTVADSLQRAREHDQALSGGGLDAAILEGNAVGALAGVSIPSRARNDVRTLLRASTLLERVIRGRRRAIGRRLTATRRLIRVPVEYREEEVAVLDVVRTLEDPADRAAVMKQACSSWEALAGMAAGKTRELSERLAVIRDARAGRRPDAKLEALLDLCARIWAEDPSAKVVIRCEYALTRDLVFEQLRRLLSSGALRRSTPEEISAWGIEQDDAVGPVARLKDQGQDTMLEALRNPDGAGRSMLAHLWAFERINEGGAVALVADDIAAMGLNLQFASALILYDLPWTPGMVEQWIGRLDRLGQRAGEVRVYAMSHRALPTERLLDVYESIGLFDQRGFHVAPEIESKISDLLRTTDDESSWEEAVAAVQRLIDDEREDAAQGESLDLPLEEVPSQEDSQRSIRGFIAALVTAGFSAEARRDGGVRLEWPLSDADALWLPGASAALRPREAAPRSNPETIAAARERSRALNITGGRLGEGRWLREWNVDLFSPRHPLYTEVEDDLLADPSLALGGFSCSSARTKAPRGVYLLVQAQTYPALGGAAMAWRCRVPDSVLQDDELARMWTSVQEALQRMMRVRCRAVLARAAWLLDPRGDAARLVPEERVDELLTALPYAGTRAPSLMWPNLEAHLAALERPHEPLPPELISATAAVAEEVSREAGLHLGRVIARRKSSVESTGEGDAWRGLRDARRRALETAHAMRDLVEDLPSHARRGALEAATPRVVAAAVIEVRP